MATVDIKPDVRSNEDCGRGETWSVQDTRHLISVWGDPSIQKQLRGLFRNNTVYDEICRRLKEHGVHRTPTQCRNKTKNLRKGFRELKLRNGHGSKSITRQSSLFFTELERVWGKDFLTNPGEFEGQEGPVAFEYKETDETAEMHDGCSLDGANMSDNEPRNYEPHNEMQSEDPTRVFAPSGFAYSPQPSTGFVDRDRLGYGSMMATLQQLNQDNMERIRETVTELNRSFLEHQAVAEERREKLNKDHEIRLYEMLLNRSGKSPQSVIPVKLSQSGIQSHKRTQSHHVQPGTTQAPTTDVSSHLQSTDERLAGVEEQTLRRDESPSSVTLPLSRAPTACSSSLRCLALRLHPGDDIKECLSRLVEERGIQAACIVSCVGSIRNAELRLADSKTILKLNGNHEIVSLVGTLSSAGMHLHASLSDEEGKVIGGHVFGSMEVFTTAEIVIGELPSVVFKREMDEETGYRELVVEPDEV